MATPTSSPSQRGSSYEQDPTAMRHATGYMPVRVLLYSDESGAEFT